MQDQPTPILVKRYAGSRLYNTVAAAYVTIQALQAWRRNGIAFQIIEAQTGEDVTNLLLA